MLLTLLFVVKTGSVASEGVNVAVFIAGFPMRPNRCDWPIYLASDLTRTLPPNPFDLGG